MTWKIGMIWKMKYVVAVVDKKDEFEHVLQIILANAIATVSLGYLNSSVFHCS